jgi:hypothetical protein
MRLSSVLWFGLAFSCSVTVYPSGLQASNSNPQIWISSEELARLPMAGKPWEKLRAAAGGSPGRPRLSDQDQSHNVIILAKALVYGRCSTEADHSQCQDVDLTALRVEIVGQIMAIRETENGGRTLSLGRELAAYVIAADIVKLPAREDEEFRGWLRAVRHETLGGRTLISTHEDRPNNWGTHAGASRIAASLYLGDESDVKRAAAVFKGWLGDRSAYAGFRYGDLSWQCDADRPVGINPSGCTKEGHFLDGALPDDQRRGGRFRWPPPKENYVYEALQGAIVQAVLLRRAGFDAFNWEDQALLRAYRWLHVQARFPPVGDDTWQLPIVDCVYGTRFWNGSPTRPGKNMGWTGWTHSPPGSCVGAP